jgi:S-adenosylmethionine synthetase
MDQVICAALPVEMLDNSTKYYINPTGRFVVGGPAGDTGLTGRKIIADTYGGYARHGGGSFSGKDPSKVDRSGAYMARFIAKNIVACGMAEKCEVQLSYAIGIAEPVSIYVDAFNTNKCPVEEIVSAIKSKEDLTPTGIIDKFGLNAPIYAPLSCHGHFGMNAAEMPWEKIEW